MPRVARTDYAGCFHHLINRGVDKKDIFLDPMDYKTFVSYLSELLENGDYLCYAWVLMPNHFHLLIQTQQESIAKLMRRLQTRYAVYFNRKYKHGGYVFQGRYKSIVCDKDSYFKELVSYVHLNPLRAGLVGSLKELDNYRWSGHSALIGKEKLSWLAVKETLEFFVADAGSKADPVEKYLEYLSDKKGVLAQGIVPARRLYELKSMSSAKIKKVDAQPVLSVRLSLEDYAKKVAQNLQISLESLCRKGKTTQAAAHGRAVLVYWANRQGKIPLSKIAQFLNVTQSAVTQLYKKAEKNSQQKNDLLFKLLSK